MAHRLQGRQHRLALNQDSFDNGQELDPAYVRCVPEVHRLLRDGLAHLSDALGVKTKGFSWVDGNTSVCALTDRAHRALPKTRDTPALSGDLTEIIEGLRQDYFSIQIAGGGAVAGECLRRGLADEVRVTHAPC
jgi:riboflavin biosynthesis pyrimidine reductase